MGSVGTTLPHPFDPLSREEIENTIFTVKKAHGDVYFNVVSLQEPRKAEMTAWLEDPINAPRPKRLADVVVIAPGGKVYDGLVNPAKGEILSWEWAEGQQPIVSVPCLQLWISHMANVKGLDHHGRAPDCRTHRP